MARGPSNLRILYFFWSRDRNGHSVLRRARDELWIVRTLFVQPREMYCTSDYLVFVLLAISLWYHLARPSWPGL